MEIRAILVGSKGLTYAAEVLQSGVINGKTFAVHEGHNKLMHTIVVTHWETGKAVMMARVNPSVEIDKDVALKYMDYFTSKMEDFDPGDSKKINELPK